MLFATETIRAEDRVDDLVTGIDQGGDVAERARTVRNPRKDSVMRMGDGGGLAVFRKIVPSP
ncbi:MULTISPECIES: hypothetical protein [Cryobacterium]|uniref:Uncharacterized protein n=1 Tax=Cryobacterium breve TaxID=1259258 RepID=A0ABY2J3K2_9MICO|nr:MULTISPECIES: hypothetical protein [Cryobacterium]TFC91774.1 hypothetical protein E3T20_13000 [Cryobacterium sp. TmT3-12]TFC98323.1 hypothetical protein E3O65_08220 [Cryobacterium breve]